MATSRIMTLHIGKGRTIAQMLADSTGYGLNPRRLGRASLSQHTPATDTPPTRNFYLPSANTLSSQDADRRAT